MVKALLLLIALAVAIVNASTDLPEQLGEGRWAFAPPTEVTTPSIENGYGKCNGPLTWANNFPTCGGSRQSPINIRLKKAKLLPDDAENALFFKYYDAPPSRLTVANAGLSLKMTGNWSTARRPRVAGYLLSGDYAMAGVHFHWGANSKEGSEHLLRGESFPLEMHVVHYKMAYGSLAEAVKNDDGLAVLGYFFRLCKRKNPGLQRLIEVSGEVIDADSSPVSIEPFTLNKLAPPFTRNYVSYKGSLTTPPCSEIVTWIVNLEPLDVSLSQLEKLRRLRDENGKKVLFNFRPVEPLNGRTIRFIP